MPAATHHHVEGAVGDVLPSKAHVDDVAPRRRRGVEDVEGAILVLQDLGLSLAAVGPDYQAAHLPLPGPLGAHHHAQLLSHGDAGAHARTCGTARFLKEFPHQQRHSRHSALTRRPHTSHRALAGVARRHGADSVGRGWDVVASVLDDDGVAARAVGEVGDAVGTVAVVLDAGPPGFAILILKEGGEKQNVTAENATCYFYCWSTSTAL